MDYGLAGRTVIVTGAAPISDALARAHAGDSTGDSTGETETSA